jgi:hypothetical protein
MTLHNTAVLIKKAGIGSFVGITTILLIVIFIRVGISIKNSLYPPVKKPPVQTFGVLPPLQFPKNAVNNNFTYTINTLSGELPTGLPDRLSVFPIVESAPNFLNLDWAKKKVASIGLVSQDGTALPEIQLTNPYYEWDEPMGLYRKIIMNINSFDFKMTSNYLSSLGVLSAKFISDEKSAVNVAQNFLNSMVLTPNDIDLTKTTTQDNPMHYVTNPRLYYIQNGLQGSTLVQTAKLSQAQVIWLDFYQKDVEYDLNTGVTEGAGQKAHLKLPILYPNPPHSTMSFWIASGPDSAMVTQALFTHKNIDFKSADATYGIKTSVEAFAELKGGKAYIATYDGSDSNITITDIYLAYYLAEDSKDYLMPIYVFEGKNGFFAYVSALAI